MKEEKRTHVGAYGLIIIDGIDSNGCFFYKINELTSKDITPFTKEGLELLGYKIND